MKRILAFLAVIIFCISIASCSKENVSGNNNPDPVVPDTTNNNNNSGTGTYVDKAFYIDSTATGEDTTAMSSLIYDNVHRVTWTYDSLKNAGIWVFFISSNFEYAGSDTLAFKQTQIVVEPTMVDTNVHYFFYNNAGRIQKDSSIKTTWQGGSITYRNSIVKTYEYPPGKIYGQELSQQLFPTTGSINVIRDTATLDANDNMVSNIKNINGFSRYVTTMTYDNHPNPLKNLSIFQNGDIFPIGWASVYAITPSPNNVIHVSDVRTGSSAGTDDLPIQITYGSNGYPIVMKAAVLSTPGSYEKITFHYRSF